MSTLDIARQHIAQGHAVVPVPYREKAPAIKEWQKLRITDKDVEKYFSSTEPQNIGVLLGAPSGNLVDVDLDTPEARAVAPFFLPQTHAVFGRKSSRRAHYLYVADRAPGTKAFNDPMAKEGDTKARIVELRGTGGQTVLPGSTHRDTGELIEWESAGDPARVSYAELLQDCALIATCALIASNWDPGTRDDICTATTGILLRAGFEDREIQDALQAIGAAADDEKIDSRMEKIGRLRSALENDGRVPGFPKLAELTDSKVAAAVARWLHVKDVVPFEIAPVNPDWLVVAPPPLSYIVEPLFPQRTVALLIAEGATGKTTFAMRVAVAVAGDRTPLWGMKVTSGPVAYVALEDQEDSLRRRVHRVVSREQERMRRDGDSPEAIGRYLAALARNFFLVAGAGHELHLIISKYGEVQQSGVIDALIGKLPQPLVLVVLDPMARLNGAEENNNTVGTALINAAERIARRAQCAVILPHHTGKAAARDQDEGQYSARGSSGLADAARSVVRLLPVTAVKGFENVPPDALTRGDLIKVVHAKFNEGRKAPPFFLLRNELDFELLAPEMMSAQRVHSRIMSALFVWWRDQHDRQPFTQSRIDSKEAVTEIFGALQPAREQVRDAYVRAVREGDLIPAGERTARSHHPLMRFKADYADPEAAI